MNIESGNKKAHRQIKKIFNTIAATDIQNKEVAALMGQVDEENPNVLPGGLISKLGLTDAKLAHIKAKKRDKDFMDWLLREAIRQSLRQINEIIDELQKQIKDLLERMTEVEEELAKLDEQYETLESELEFFQEKGLFDCNEYGRFKNPETEAILIAWEQETGQKIDRTDTASYEIILQILVDIEQRQIILRNGLKKDAAEYEFRQQQLDEALQIREDLQSDDKMLNRNALYDFEGFINGYNLGLETASQNEIEVTSENDLLVKEGLDELPENLDTDLSFGFPPLQKNFAEAVEDDETIPGKNRINPNSSKKSTLIVKPTN